MTDIRLQPTDAHSVDCGYGYEKKATVIQTRGGDGASNKDKVKGSKLMGLCLQKRACDMDSKYVSEVFAIVSGERDLNVNKTGLPDNCEFIGQWQPTWAMSYSSGEKSTNTTAIYQCKKSCTSEMCASVKLLAMTPSAPPKVIQKANAVGINGNELLNQCTAWHSAKETHTITDAETYTNTNEYTTDSSIESYFKTTLSAEVNVWAEEGFECGFAKASAKESYDVSTSASAGFTNRMHKGSNSLHSRTTKAVMTESALIHAKSGEATILRTTYNSLSYEQTFTAYAQCINEDGDVLETKKISGNWSAKVHAVSGETATYSSADFCSDPDSWNCVMKGDKKTSDRRRLVDRLFGH